MEPTPASVFNVFQSAFTGLKIDMATVISGGFSLLLILVGFSWVVSLLNGVLNEREQSFFMAKARKLKEERDMTKRGSFEWDEANALYRSALNKAASRKVSKW